MDSPLQYSDHSFVNYSSQFSPELPDINNLQLETELASLSGEGHSQSPSILSNMDSPMMEYNFSKPPTIFSPMPMDGETGSGRPPRSTGVSAPSHRQERNAGNSSGSPGGDESAPGEPGGTGGLDQGIPPKRRHCRRRPRYRPYLQAPRTIEIHAQAVYQYFSGQTPADASHYLMQKN